MKPLCAMFVVFILAVLTLLAANFWPSVFNLLLHLWFYAGLLLTTIILAALALAPAPITPR